MSPSAKRSSEDRPERPFLAVEEALRARRPEQAARALRRALGSGGMPWEPFLWLGRIEMLRGRAEAAAQLYRKGLDSAPEAYSLWVEYARALEELGRLEESEAAFRRAMASPEPSAELRIALARVLRKGGKEAQAEQVYLDGLRADPSCVELALEHARALEGAGRLGEAAEAFAGALRLAPGSEEAALALGRLRAKQGRPGEAEHALRRAATLRPRSARAKAELFRLLQKGGRTEDGRALLRRAARADAARFARAADASPRKAAEEDESSRELMAFEDYRRTLLDAARRAGALPRLEAALRAQLRARPRDLGARIMLAEALAGLGRAGEAERELARVLAPAPGDDVVFKLSLACSAVERGSYGPALERALLGYVAKAEPAADVQAECTHVFSALMCGRRYPSAFRLGEALLDRFGGFASPDQVMWPWWKKSLRALAENPFLEEELRCVREAGRKGGFPQWFAYYRAILAVDLGRPQEALKEFGTIRALDRARYVWMLQPFVLVCLCVNDFDGTLEACRAILARYPSHWWVRCRMAEALLAKGERGAALRELARAEEGREDTVRREVLTWHGEILLWLGDYRAAEEKFDAAIALGATTFVYGWRGGARLKRGDLSGALEDLDRAVQLDAKDFEARGWRGEAFRLLGRHREARADLEYVLRHGPQSCWVGINLALLKGELGDTAGMRALFSGFHANVRAFLLRRAGLPEDQVPEPARLRRVLEEGLEAGRGVRRWETYVEPIWMRPQDGRGRPCVRRRRR